MAQGGRGEEPGVQGDARGRDAIPREPVPSASRPPTMSISLVRELTRSETEECGSVLRSDSSCGGCPGTGAVFTALPPAGNLGKERQRLRGEGPRAEGETARGSPGTLSRRMLLCQPPREAAGRDAGRAGLQGCPGLRPPSAAHQCPRTEGSWPAGSARDATRQGRVPAGALGHAALRPGARQQVHPVTSQSWHPQRPRRCQGCPRLPCPHQHPRFWLHLTHARPLQRGLGAEPPHGCFALRCRLLAVPLSFCHRAPHGVPQPGPPS